MQQEREALRRLMEPADGFGLRDYQREAVEAAMREVRKTTTPALITAATGAGKSWIIGALALSFRVAAGRASARVLVVQPSAELVRQNFEKLVATGARASTCSASLGKISLRLPIVYCTPGTIEKRLPAIAADVVAIIVDEAEHNLASTIRIVEEVRKGNPRVRVVGLTATPYRLGTGFVFAMDADGAVTSATDPFFGRRVYDISARALIDAGHLTDPVILPTDAEPYDTSSLTVTRRGGPFRPKEVTAVFAGQGRKTARIVADAVERTAGMRAGIIFAATVQHAEEIAESLPTESRAVVSAKTSKTERAELIERFRSGALRWIINVDILTRGFDAPVADHIVLMRATESAALLQQIIGRILRKAPDKPRAYILDYAGNVERHFPGDRDIFDPEIRVSTGGGAEAIRFDCPACSSTHDAKILPAWDGADYDKNGYVVDYRGERIAARDGGGDIAVHTLRRCGALMKRPGVDELQPCGFWFQSKPCEGCGAPNDIAARYCSGCGAELIDPNDKLSLRSVGKVSPLAHRVTRFESVEISMHRARSGSMWEIVSARGIGDFWIPLEPDTSFQNRLRLKYLERTDAHDAVRWRKSPRSSSFLEFSEWVTARTCEGCEGAGIINENTHEGPQSGACLACAGTGLVA